MSTIWGTGFDPQKADKGLRGIGLFVILLAFLFASNQFVSKDKATPTATTPAKPPAVFSDGAITQLLRQIDVRPSFAYPNAGATTPPTTTAGSTPAPAVTPAAPATTTPPLSGIDVIVTANPDLMDRLVAAKQCAAPVDIGVDPRAKPARSYQACAVFHGRDVRPTAQAFIGELTSVAGRVVLLDAGFDLPPRS